MNTPDIYLYANGRLRLTKFGPKAGGNVLVLVRDDGRTDQCELADDKSNIVDRIEAASGPLTEKEVVSMFDVIRSVHAIPGSTRLAA